MPKKPRIRLTARFERSRTKRSRSTFDAVYQKLFRPALEAAGLQPFRADDEEAAGDILKDMFAELVTADFVLADISILNANVFYELGIRHTVGPRGVICLHAGWADRPFDVAPQRTFKYDGKLFARRLEHDAAWESKSPRRYCAWAKLCESRRGRSNDRGEPRLWQSAETKTLGCSEMARRASSIPGAIRGVESAREDLRKGGRAEDILTLAGDVPSPYYRRKLLRQCGDALLALGRFAQSEKVFKELCEDLDGAGSAEEFRVKTQLALLANRLGRTREAEQKLSDLAKSHAR